MEFGKCSTKMIGPGPTAQLSTGVRANEWQPPSNYPSSAHDPTTLVLPSLLSKYHIRLSAAKYSTSIVRYKTSELAFLPFLLSFGNTSGPKALPSSLSRVGHCTSSGALAVCNSSGAVHAGGAGHLAYPYPSAFPSTLPSTLISDPPHYLRQLACS